MKTIPLTKQSKKQQRAFYAAKRGSWNGVNPVTRTVPSKKGLRPEPPQAGKHILKNLKIPIRSIGIFSIKTGRKLWRFSRLTIPLWPCYFEIENRTLAYKECARDKPDDRTAACREVRC